MKNTPENMNIFIAYSHEDKAYLEELRVHLSILERINLVDKIWYDGLIQAGTNWQNTIYNALENADIILLLVSADFIASDFCYEKEMTRAIDLHDAGKVKTIPIIIRPCLWKQTPFGKLQALPKEGFPIASAHWENKDEPYKQVVESIEKIILDQKSSQATEEEDSTQSSFTNWIEEGNRLMENKEWNKAQAQFRETLLLYRNGFQPSLVIINQKIETCQNEIYFHQNFTQAKTAYQEGDYQTALGFFQQALLFKADDSEALKLKEACEAGLEMQVEEELAISKEPAITIEKQTKPDRTKIFQIKIFGMEIFKLIVALSAIGLVATMSVKMLFNSADSSEWSALRNEEEGIIEIVNANKMEDPSNPASASEKIETNFVEAKDFSEGLLAVKNEQGDWGYISINDGKVATEIKFIYEGAWPHSSEEKLAYVKRNGKCGFINLKGEETIQLAYLDAASFSEGLAMVKKGTKDFAFINAQGKEVISGLDSVITRQFTNGEAWVVREKKEILINTKGKCLNGCRQGLAPNLGTTDRNEAFENFMKKAMAYKEAKNYQRALVVLQDASKIAKTEKEKTEVGNQIDLVERKIELDKQNASIKLRRNGDRYFATGDYLSALKLYRQAAEIKDTEALKASRKTCETYIEREKTIKSPIYAFAHPSKLLGIKNSKREVLLSPQFERSLKYSNGMIAVQKNGKWGFVDLKGNIAISIQYDRVSSFNSNNQAKVVLAGKSMLIDKKGKCLNCGNAARTIDYNRYFLKKAEQLRLDALDMIAKKVKFKVNRAEYVKNCNFGLDVQATKKCKELSISMRGFGKITSREQLNKSLEKYKTICNNAVKDYMRRGGIKYDTKILEKILGTKRVIKIN